MKSLPDSSRPSFLAGISGPAANQLSPGLNHILALLRTRLSLDGGDKDISESELGRTLAAGAGELGFDLSSLEMDLLISYLQRENRPFGILQELVANQEISDIIVSHYAGVAVQSKRRTIKTDLAFPDQGAYEAFVERLLLKAGTSYSTKKPIADGMIGSLARVHAVHKSLCEAGPYLTIRLNRFSRVSLDDLAYWRLAPKELLDYLSALTVKSRTILVSGETGTGKTTLVRAASGAIPASESILVIEDVPEIRLEHPNVRSICTREANSENAGKVSPGECIRAGMRMAMNRIIFGEIRDAEAAEAFIDVCASGHSGLSTVHGRSALEALGRLELFLGRTQRGVGRDVLREQIASAVQVVVQLGVCPLTSEKRVLEVVEICGFGDGVIRYRPMFRYSTKDSMPRWEVLSKTSRYRSEIEASGVFLHELPQSLGITDVRDPEEYARRGGAHAAQ